MPIYVSATAVWFGVMECTLPVFNLMYVPMYPLDVLYDAHLLPANCNPVGNNYNDIHSLHKGQSFT